MYDKEYKSLTLRLGFAMLLMFVLLQGLMTVLEFAQIAMQALLSEKVGNLIYWVLYNVFYYVSFMLPIPFFMLISKGHPSEKIRFDLSFPPRFALMTAAIIGLTLAAGQINSLLLAPFAGADTGTDMLLDLISRENPYMVVLVFVMVVIIPPFCEELLFRGLVLGNLLPYGKGVAIVGSALLFATMHQSYSQFLYTVVAGILLGLLYVESRSIWPSTLVHMLNNLLSFIQMILFARIQDEMLAGRIMLCMNIAVMFAGVICAVILVLTHKKKAAEPCAPVSLFGNSPRRGALAGERELSSGVAVRAFFSPTMAVFICLSLALAVLNLIMEMAL